LVESRKDLLAAFKVIAMADLFTICLQIVVPIPWSAYLSVFAAYNAYGSPSRSKLCYWKVCIAAGRQVLGILNVNNLPVGMKNAQGQMHVL